MSVFMVQHGLSLPKEQDPQRGLTEAGIADVIPPLYGNNHDN